MQIIPPHPLPIIDAPGMRTLCVADLNTDGGSKRVSGRTEPLTTYLVNKAARNVDVITLQETCANQYTSILVGLGPPWTGTFRRFGQMDGCHGRQHGLSIFTRGPHSDAQAWPLPHPNPDHDSRGEKWWGLMKVTFKGIEIYNTHIRSWDRVRKEQTVSVLGKVARPGVGKAILAGDFNQTPDSPEFAGIYQHWVECDPSRHPTIHANGVDKKIDYIWATWKPFQMFGGAVEAPSDHGLVWALIRYR